MELCNATQNKDQQFELEYTGRNVKDLASIHKEVRRFYTKRTYWYSR